MKFPLLSRKQNSQKTCKKCGVQTDTLYNEEYCEDCYSVIFDKGIETTSEWGRETAFKQYMDALTGSAEDNLFDYNRALDSVLSFFETSTWVCTNCQQQRLAVDEAKNNTKKEIMQTLMAPCPKCDKTGYLHSDIVD